MLARERCVARVLADRRRPHRHPRLALAHATREIGIGRGDELAEPRAGRGVPVERRPKLVERRYVEAEPGRHAERGREATQIRGLPAYGRRVQGGWLTQPGDLHGARV